MDREIDLKDLITKHELACLVKFIKDHPDSSTHNAIMAWLEKHKTVRSRWAKFGILKQFGAYLIEHYALR